MPLQNKTVNCKTIVEPEKIFRFLQNNFPSASCVCAKHEKCESHVEHFHYVVFFHNITRWNSLRDFLMVVDPHSYSDGCRSVARSVRYLLHLDHPNKEQIPLSALSFHNMSLDDIDVYLHGSRIQPIASTLSDLSKLTTIEAINYIESNSVDVRFVRSYLDFISSFERFKGSSFAKTLSSVDSDSSDSDNPFESPSSFYEESLATCPELF